MTDNQLFVLDASIIIDICHGSILREAFSLWSSAISPDLVVDEVQEADASVLEKLGLQKHGLTGDQLTALQQEAKSFKGLTHKDVASLLLALERGAVLLTGDDGLRRHAERRGIEVHGILWILDCLVESGVLNHGRAATALESICKEGSWLPQEECRKRFDLWETSGDQKQR